MRVDLSRTDWAARIAAGESLLPAALPLHRVQAERAVRVFDRLRLPDVEGRPLLADACGDWFRDLIRALFGSYDAATRERFIREVFLLVPKKNSKTTYGAALMLVATLLSPRPRAEFLFVAPTLEIAGLAFSQAVGMIEADPALARKCHIQSHIRQITYLPTGAFLKVKSFDPRTVTGSKPCGVLLDETHVIAETVDADRVIGQLRGGLISQPEGFLVQITTQSERPPAGVFRAELLKARAVRDGRLVAPILPLLYEFPPGVDWRDPATWRIVTPNNGRSVDVARLVDDYHAAVEAGEGELRRWASQHLNVEIGIALGSDRWPGALDWEAQAREGLTLEALLEACDAVAVGIDAGGPDDWLGLAVLGRETGSGHWLCWSRAWVHERAIETYKGEGERWRDYERAGDLVVVPALGPDVVDLVALVRRVYESEKLVRVGLDPAGGAKVLHQSLIVEGELPEDLFVGIGQGWRLQGVQKLIERRLSEGTFWHAGQTMLTYCVGNARVELRGNAAVITKACSKGKIDALMALFDAGEILAMAPGVLAVDAMIAPA